VRADAQRNYDRIIEVARQVFAERGTDASMDEIAKRSGVGPGTLYRHFPNRDTLYDALMKDWVARVHASADKAVASELPARDLLLGWFEDYVHHISAHRGGPAKITSAMDDAASPMHRKCQALTESNAKVLARVRELGALRDGTDSVQVCRLVGGIATVADQGGLGHDAVRPLLEVVADGLLRPSG
jgi:AcrR family transcriptional regulator